MFFRNLNDKLGPSKTKGNNFFSVTKTNDNGVINNIQVLLAMLYIFFTSAIRISLPSIFCIRTYRHRNEPWDGPHCNLVSISFAFIHTYL